MGKDIAVIVADTKGGLYDAAQGKGFSMIGGTERQFNSLTTHVDEEMIDVGLVDTQESGWVGLARKDS